MTAGITKRLEWLRGKGSDNPVLLEEYKTYVLELDSRIKHVAPMVRDLEVHLKELQNDLTLLREGRHENGAP